MYRRPGILLATAALAFLAAACVRIAEVPSSSVGSGGAGAPASTAAVQGATATASQLTPAAPSPTGQPPAPATATPTVPPASTQPSVAAPTGPPASQGGGSMGSNLIVCIGVGGGGPCVRTADAATVIAAEKAIGEAGAATVTDAKVNPETCADAPAASVSCPSGATGVALVTLTTTNGATEKVFVYRAGDGTLVGQELP